MDLLLILIPPCLALMALLLSPSISILAVPALAIALSMLMMALVLQTRNMGGDGEDGREAEAVTEDITNMMRAAFAALERSPGATSTSFRVVDGTVVPPYSAAGAPRDVDASANAIWEEDLDEGNGNAPRMVVDSWPEPWGTHSTSSSHPGFREGRETVRGFDRYRFSVRRLEGSEWVAHMV